MTQKQSTPAQAPAPTNDAMSGNKAAQGMADKANAMLEQLISPAISPKLSELPTVEARLMAVADAIEKHALVKDGIGFNMLVWRATIPDARDLARNHVDFTHAEELAIDRTGHQCGTVACIAGWVDIMEDGVEDGARSRPMWRARDILGLSENTARALFMGNSASGRSLMEFTDKQAVAVLRNLAKTGKVEWFSYNKNGSRRKGT